jgi:hypothetical protein
MLQMKAVVAVEQVAVLDVEFELLGDSSGVDPWKLTAGLEPELGGV